MRCVRVRLSRKAQSELIAGVLILAVLFTAVIPLMLRIQMSTLSRQENIISKAKFLQLRNEETLTVSGVPQTQQNLLRGIFPGIWINNTGSVPVTLHTLILINKTTGKIVSIIDFSQIGTPQVTPSIVEWAVINPGTPNRESLVRGIYPTLQPGDSLLIKLAIPTDQASQYYFRVVTARGNVLPNAGTGAAYLVPPATLAGGGGGTWRGLFYPTSGFKLIGADQILAHADVYAERPTGRISNAYISGISKSFIFDDYDHPGYYVVGYCYASGICYKYTGFLGTFYMGTDFVYIDGFYQNEYISYDHGNTYMLIDTNPVEVYNYPGGFGVVEDYDNNGVKELALDTINSNADNYGGLDDDVMIMKILIGKDITNADYIRISAKITYDYYVHIMNYGDNYRMDLRIFYVAIYRYTPQGWRFVHYKDMPFSEHGPRSFVFDALFPLNRSDIYRVVLMLLDPYRYTGSRYYEFYIGLEYLLVEWGINNPYFKNLPTVYLLALNNYAAQGIGGGNVTEDLQKLTSLVENKLLSVGISNYIVINNESLLDNLLINNPPKNAIIINLHGMQSPIDPAIVMDHVKNDGWIWVNIVGAPPVYPSNLVIDTSSNIIASAGANWEDMVDVFSLYNLQNSVWSNYSVVVTSPNANPTYVFYINASANKIVSAAWAEGDGYIIINSLPPLDWTGKDPHGTDPDFDATLAVFTALYVWLLTKSG